MSSDHTQHVIDSIDGALADWSVGPDAMRWSPNRPAAHSLPVRRHAALFFAPAGTPPPGRAPSGPWQRLEDADGLLLPVADAFRSMAERITELFSLSSAEASRFAETLASLAADTTADDDVDDLRTRALRLRQQRHTGPNTDVTRQRRPRHHSATRSVARTAPFASRSRR
ncbi:hypothetical protein [Blastococcus sp. CCUG 61487]|uniref:hypothetical protein n=1 Tax=Blastococcus sp. CCUG 61487 TaxID=1840703 RepID=UPI001137062B|nr:hypothetical protein [Blastococcus sp. CCUG 61487]TKJ24352.1 hypothetical protein A6V29_04970 [Blastococcus sp. CCUG 61487]